MERRRKVAEGLVAGRTEVELAHELGVSERSIQRDVALVKTDWQARMRASADEHRGRHLQRLEGLWGAFWPKAQAGDDKAGVVCLRVLDQERELLNYGAAGEGITLEYVEQEARRHGIAVPVLVMSYVGVLREQGETPPAWTAPFLLRSPVAQVIDGAVVGESADAV